MKILDIVLGIPIFILVWGARFGVWFLKPSNKTKNNKQSHKGTRGKYSSNRVEDEKEATT